MAKRPDPRGLKKHRNYTVDEAARCLNTAKGTIRRWIKSGLPCLTDQKPFLILGPDLIAFLNARRKTRQKCALDEAFCFSCRAPRKAAGGMADFTPMTPKTGDLSALCDACGTMMHKRVSTSALPAIRAVLDVSIRQGRASLRECA
jgi:hypothetical protein